MASTFERTERVVTREIAGETLLVPIHDDAADLHHVFALNPVAACVWRELGAPRSVEQLVASVCATFEVGEKRAARDVAGLLDELLEAGLVREG